MNTTILFAFIVYLVLMVVIGYIASRKLKTLSDFFIADRSIGAWVSSISSTASSESGWVLLGACGMAYKMGLAAAWLIPGVLCGFIFNWYFIANRIRVAAAESQAVTLPDLFHYWFDDSKHLLRITASIIIFLCMMGYVAAQMNATGKAFEVIFEWSYWQGVVLGGVVIIVYTIWGGFRAVAWTDLLQGLLMMAGLVIVPLIAVAHIGGFSELWQTLGTHGESFMRVDSGKSGAALFGLVAGFLGIGLGYPGLPHVLVRYMATKDERSIREGRAIAMTWGVLVYCGAVAVGLCGKALLPEIADPEQIYPTLALQLLHPLFAGIMLASLMAAIMSTADSQLLVAASSLVRDIYQKVLGGSGDQRKVVLLSRIGVVVLGIASIIFALTESRVVFWFVLFAFSGLGASFGPPILCALFTNFTTRQGVFAGMIVGFATTVIWKLTGLADKVVYELVPAFFFSLIAVLLVSKFTHSKPNQAS